MKRVLFRLKRRKFKVLVMFLLFFMLSFFLFFSILSFKANKQIEDSLKNRINPTLIINGDINNMDSSGVISYENFIDIKEAYVDLVNKYKDHELVKKHYLETYLKSTKIVSCKNANDEENYECLYLTNEPYTQKTEGIIHNFKDNMQYSPVSDYKQVINAKNESHVYDNFAYIFPYLIGVSTDDISDLNVGDVIIKEGNVFSLEDIENGSFKVVVPYNSFKANRQGLIEELHVGDKIPLSIVIDENNELNYEFEIIGFHHIDKDKKSLDEQYINRFLYIPQKCFDKILSDLNDVRAKYDISNKIVHVFDGFTSESYSYAANGSYRKTSFVFDEHTKINEFAKLIKDDLINLSEADGSEYTNYSYTTSLDSYTAALINLRSNTNLYMLCAIISMILSFATLLLFLLHDIIKNRKEYGILLSIGMSKTKLLVQNILEYVIISIPALIISSTLSSFLSTFYSKQSFDAEVLMMIKGGYDASIYSNAGDGSISSPIQINFGALDYMTLSTIWLSIIVIVCLLASIQYNRLDIKETLLKGE